MICFAACEYGVKASMSSFQVEGAGSSPAIRSRKKVTTT